MIKFIAQKIVLEDSFGGTLITRRENLGPWRASVEEAIADLKQGKEAEKKIRREATHVEGYCLEVKDL